jgi:hypothetical protein
MAVRQDWVAPGMAEVTQEALNRARETLRKALDSQGKGENLDLDSYDEDLIVRILVDELDLACNDANLALEILKEQGREIKALRAQVRAYAAGVAELRITIAALEARQGGVTEVTP